MDAKEMSDTIESALLQVLPEHGDYEEGDVLIEWVLISYVTNPDEEKMSSYPMFVSNNSMAGHRVRGLLLTGMDAYRFKEED
jgi:hypothetical protein